MSRIWKFEVQRNYTKGPSDVGNSFVQTPIDTELLSVGEEGNAIVAWGLVSGNLNLKHDVPLTVTPTGIEMVGYLGSLLGRVDLYPPGFRGNGTDRMLRFHVFQLTP